MIELFKMGGTLFMSILTIQLVGVIAVTAVAFTKGNPSMKDLDLIRSVGLFAMVTGILGQLIGLFSAFQAIEKMGSVSPDMLASGLKVSMITTLYGLIIYMISIIIWLILKMGLVNNKS